MGIPFSFQPERDMDKPNQDRDFNERPDDGGERFATIEAEHRNGNGNRQLEIV
jgi:hypothetical protein